VKKKYTSAPIVRGYVTVFSFFGMVTVPACCRFIPCRNAAPPAGLRIPAGPTLTSRTEGGTGWQTPRMQHTAAGEA